MKWVNLGRSEALLLGVVRKQGSASAREVWNHIKRRRKIAHSTIATTLNRLHKKGLLKREAKTVQSRHKHIYFLNEDQELQKRIVDRFLDTLVNAFGPAVISSISERLDEFKK